MSHFGAATFTKYELMAIVVIASLGLTALVAVGGGDRIIPMIFILGFFVLLPLIYLLGDRFPLVESPTERKETQMTPVEALNNQYATGEINHDEFEHRLDRLLEMDDQENAYNEKEDCTSQPMAERERN